MMNIRASKEGSNIRIVFAVSEKYLLYTSNAEPSTGGQRFRTGSSRLRASSVGGSGGPTWNLGIMRVIYRAREGSLRLAENV